MAVIDLFLQQTLRSNLGNFLALRAVNNSVLFDLPRAGHQLTEQRLILLAKRCLLFIVRSHSYFALVYPTQYPFGQGKPVFSPPLIARMLIYRCLHGTLAAEFIAECALEDVVDKIFVDEAVNELHTIQDMLRWAVSRFSAANIWYGHGTDNPWDEAVQLVLPSLYLPLDIPEDMRTARLTSSEKHRIVERVIRRVNERIPVAYLTNKAWFCGHEFYVDERVLVPRSRLAN